VLAGYTNWDFLLIKTDAGGAIPEFSPPVILPLLVITTLLAVVMYRKKSIKIKQHGVYINS